MIQIEVVKNKSESTANLIRRFTKKSKNSGLMRKARAIRFKKRSKSEFVKKKDALKRIRHQEETEKLYKLGKVTNVYGKKSK